MTSRRSSVSSSVSSDLNVYTTLHTHDEDPHDYPPPKAATPDPLRQGTKTSRRSESDLRRSSRMSYDSLREGDDVDLEWTDGSNGSARAAGAGNAPDASVTIIDPLSRPEVICMTLSAAAVVVLGAAAVVLTVWKVPL
ncbi:hypothetical protein BOTBODRAFT_38736 [Botryobasidium botryosum FD-172 SS1]|uniref:Uncharacterized protein n=1 Tax=Botryobasidium botryosum (strain FD-172 SS1) TaxID=930990 RepID=A0A067M6M7_BOTB1|nr:hypothetical protein BOTBODRAFT_38736 [Botryobasidium botryosum FD-172 SS1]